MPESSHDLEQCTLGCFGDGASDGSIVAPHAQIARGIKCLGAAQSEICHRGCRGHQQLRIYRCNGDTKRMAWIGAELIGVEGHCGRYAASAIGECNGLA